MSAKRLFEDHNHVYFWTITFACVQDDWVASKKWRAFLNHLRQVIGRGWGGLRVTELHKEHGVHFHMLVTERLAVDLVRRVGRCHGIGRIQVCKADSGSGDYMAKYLSKTREGALTETGRQARRWAKFGEVKHTRVSDVVCDSPMWRLRHERKWVWTSYSGEHLLNRYWWQIEDQENFEVAWQLARNGDLDALSCLVGSSLRVITMRGGAKVLAEAEPWRSVGPNCPF